MKREIRSDKKNFFTNRESFLLIFMALLIGLIIGSLVPNKSFNASSSSGDENLDELISNYNYIIDNYYEDVDKSKLVDGAISGMMEALDDPYSMYFDDASSDNFSITLNGSYKGLGIQITKDATNNYMLITSVYNDSPAYNAGLKIGDYITKIDSTETTNLESSEFSSIVRESDKDTYLLSVLRDGEEIEVEVKKETVTIKSVTSDFYEKDGINIGYIYMGIFASNTYSQFLKELKSLEEKNIDYLIIDVRDNSGGHLTTVDSILDIFLTEKQIMYGFEQSGKKSYVYGTGDESKKYKIILLGNENSASASEVLIAGLKENLNSIFIGKKTYGKGTVQEMNNLSDGTQYKITTKKWITPKGNWINDTEGILPDIEVNLDDKYFETYSKEDDTQLNKAFEYIIENK